MPAVRPMPKEQFADLLFPIRGIDKSSANERQLPLTTPTGQNVRAFDPGTNRARGASRPGLSRYINQQVSGLGVKWFISGLDSLVVSGINSPGGALETSNSGRIVILVAVSQGNVRVAVAGDTQWTTPTNGNGVLNTNGVVFSAVNQQKLWFADGTNWQFYDPQPNSVLPWTPSAGLLPVDSAGNAPRLIATWRGRTVLSGLLLDPINWFMSAVNDPTNFDYSPLSTTPTQAVAGNNSPVGMLGDVITSLVPYNDDVLIFGGDHTIWIMNGDPMNGGAIDLVSDSIGFAWGMPWAKDPYGNVYFVSNRTGIYKLTPPQNVTQAGIGGGSGATLQRISQQIEQLLSPIDTGANTIRLLWNDRFQGLHIFVSPTGTPGTTTHFFWEQRTGAWWTDTFGNTNLNPLACCVFDGNAPGDRVPLIGSWDGYVRAIDPTAPDDDGTAISSAVVLGPILTKDFDKMNLRDLQALLGTTSGNVTFGVYLGPTAEAALASTPVVTGTWKPGRNLTGYINRDDHAIYVKITATNTWAMEAIRAKVRTRGRIQRRSST